MYWDQRSQYTFIEIELTPDKGFGPFYHYSKELLAAFLEIIDSITQSRNWTVWVEAYDRKKSKALKKLKYERETPNYSAFFIENENREIFFEEGLSYLVNSLADFALVFEEPRCTFLNILEEVDTESFFWDIEESSIPEELKVFVMKSHHWMIRAIILNSEFDETLNQLRRGL